MQDRREQRPAEIALIVIVSLVIGLALGAAGGFLIGRSVGQPAVQVVTAVSTTAPPATEMSTAAPTLVPSQASVIAAAPSVESSQVGPTAAPTVAASPVAATGQATAIPIPVARTATLPAPVSVDVTITDQRATELAETIVASSPAGAFLSAPQVRFTTDAIELSGEVNDPLGRVGSGPLVVRGRPVIEGTNLRIKLDQATVNGSAVPASVVAEIEAAINEIFRTELADRKVERISGADGLINVTVLQR